MLSSDSVAPVTPAPVLTSTPAEAPHRRSYHIHAEFAEAVRGHLLPVLRATVAEHRRLINEAENLMNAAYRQLDDARNADDQTAFFRIYTEYHRSVYALIEPRYPDNPDQSYPTLFPDFAEATERLLLDLPIWHTEVQPEDRFTTLTDDKPGIRILKFFKRRHRSIVHLPQQLRNACRRLAKQSPQPLSLRTYRIPLRSLTQYYYRAIWATELLPTLEEMRRQLAANTLRLWRFEDQLYTRLHHHLVEHYAEHHDWLTQLPALSSGEHTATIAELRQELDQLETTVVAAVEVRLSTIYEQYSHAYERVGTAELPVRRFGVRRWQRQQRQAEQRFKSSITGWHNTLYALYEDWRIDQEINLLCTTLFNEHMLLKESLRTKIDEAVVPQVDRIAACISDAEQAVRTASEDATPPGERVKKTLQQQREVIDTQLIRSVIPATVAVLYRQALPATVSGVYKRIQAAVDTVADKRALVSTNTYDQPIRTAEINYVSPRRIVGFESLPKLRDAIGETKESVGQQVVALQKMMTEIGQVSYFNLDSALSVYEDADEDPTGAGATAEEGLQRAYKSTDLVKEKLRETHRTIEAALWQSIKQFNGNLVALKSNDYALEIKLRIAKAKALERTQALKQRSLDYVRHGIPYAVRFVQLRYRRAAEVVHTYRQRIGISPEATGVTTEVSDFLNDTEVAIARLPYVYQRLYGNRSLEDAVFYEERGPELARLQKAYHNWGRGRYASTILVGERGAGATTLINFFLKKLPPVEMNRYTVVRIADTERMYTEADLLQLISTLFAEANFSSLDEVVAYLNASRRPHIIAWEDLQHFYLRKVGGFGALKLLFELISRTHKQVFWLCACTQYAWDFLDKTTRISDYYEYVIPLEAVSSEQLQEAILKRHLVSGYRIRYAGTGRDRVRRKFAKMTEAQQQTYLQQVYFEDLKALTAGNYSIAQLYWLRSTQQVLDDTITISSLQMMDFSFTQSLPVPQMLILHALLLHDGLSEAHLRAMSEAQRSTNMQLGLIPLCDDGLVTQDEGTYAINPLLYRQIVQLLRSKNFLH